MYFLSKQHLVISEVESNMKLLQRAENLVITCLGLGEIIYTLLTLDSYFDEMHVCLGKEMCIHIICFNGTGYLLLH